MSRGSGIKYYLALISSGISVLGWIGVLALGLYAVYVSLTDGPLLWVTTGILVSLAVGVAFARIEKRLYRIDE